MKKLLLVLLFLLLIPTICFAGQYKYRYNDTRNEYPDLIRGDDPIFNGTVTVGEDLTIGESLTVEDYIDSKRIFGGLYTYEAGMSQNLTSADTYYVVRDWSESGSNLITLDGTNGTLTVQRDGQYQLGINMSAAANKVSILHGDAWVNGVDTEKFSFRRKISTTNQYGNMSSPILYIDLDNGDVIDFRIKSDTANTTVSTDHGGISLLRIGRKTTDY